MRSSSDDRGDTRVESSRTVRLAGAHGTATTLVQLSDGSLEIRTAAMTAAGQAVRVYPDGSARTISL